MMVESKKPETLQRPAIFVALPRRSPRTQTRFRIKKKGARRIKPGLENLAGTVQLKAASDEETGIRVPGLASDRLYRVSLQTVTENVRRANRRFDNPLFGEGFVLMGHALGTVRIGLPALYAQTRLAIAVDAVDGAP